jgi:hypothetical protein
LRRAAKSFADDTLADLGKSTGRPGRPPDFRAEVRAYALQERGKNRKLTVKQLKSLCRQKYGEEEPLPDSEKAFRSWLNRGTSPQKDTK